MTHHPAGTRVGKLGEEGVVRLVKSEFDRIVVNFGDGLQRRANIDRRCVCVILPSVGVENHIVRVESGTVRKLYALAEVKGVLLSAVADVPCFSQTGFDLAILPVDDQRLIDELVMKYVRHHVGGVHRGNAVFAADRDGDDLFAAR